MNIVGNYTAQLISVSYLTLLSEGKGQQSNTGAVRLNVAMPLK